MEFLMSLLLLVSFATTSKPLSQTSGSAKQGGAGHYTQTSPPPMCDPNAQNCS